MVINDDDDDDDERQCSYYALTAVHMKAGRVGVQFIYM